MEILQFKTNIKCSGCIAKVTPVLDEAVGSGHWSVDIENPEKILTVRVNGEKEDKIKSSVERAGFKAEVIK